MRKAMSLLVREIPALASSRIVQERKLIREATWSTLNLGLLSTILMVRKCSTQDCLMKEAKCQHPSMLRSTTSILIKCVETLLMIAMESLLSIKIKMESSETGRAVG